MLCHRVLHHLTDYAVISDTLPTVGVLAFYRELDLGITGSDDWDDDKERLGNLVFLSARPHVYKDLSESQSYRKFGKLRESRCVHVLLLVTRV